MLDPDVVLRADDIAVKTAAARAAHGAPSLVAEARGAHAVATIFKGHARGALRAIIDGEPGAVWAQGGQTRSAFIFTIEGEAIVGIELTTMRAAAGQLDVVVRG